MTGEQQWQPVRIAPEKEILKHHPSTRFGKHAGRIIRVCVYDGMVRWDRNQYSTQESIGVLPPCGATQVFVVHPDDALDILDGEHTFLAVCEHQIQAD